MARKGSSSWVLQNVWQFMRFALVGACNTMVDFGVTNLLAFLFQPASGPAFFAISFVACSIATLNSYLWNQRWTFRSAAGEPAKGAFGKFLLVALVSLLVNTSSFLFFLRVIPERFDLPPVLVLNLAKLAGVVAAFTVAFLGYRFGVFHTEAVREFRKGFGFDLDGGASFRVQAFALALAALAVRLAYALGLTSAVYGEALRCQGQAVRLAAGLPPLAGIPFNLFCIFESVLLRLGLSPHAAACLASLLPGLALVLLCAWVARQLFGSRAAWIAGAFAALHPRLVEYSCNGAPDGLAACLLLAGAACWIPFSRDGRLSAAAGSGACFALAAAVRGELTLLAVLLLPLVCQWNRPAEGGREAAGRPPFRGRTAALCFAAAFGTVLWLWNAASGGAPAWKGFEEQTPVSVEAGTPAAVAAPAGDAPAPLARYARTLLKIVEIAPGVLVTPAPLFAMLLPIFMGRWAFFRRAAAPLLVVVAFPFLYYPLAWAGSGFLLPVLAPLQVFAAAGVMALAAYTSREVHIAGLRQWLVGGTLVLSALVCVWRGLEVQYMYGGPVAGGTTAAGRAPAANHPQGSGY